MDEETEALHKLGEIVIILKRLGIVRTTDLEGDIGSHYAKQKLKLKLASVNQKGYDAQDKYGKKYEIKTRRSPDSDTLRTQFSKVLNKNFDFLITVNLDYDYSLLLMVKIPYNVAMDLAKRNQAGNVVISKNWLENNEELVLYRNEKVEKMKFRT